MNLYRHGLKVRSGAWAGCVVCTCVPIVWDNGVVAGKVGLVKAPPEKMVCSVFDKTGPSLGCSALVLFYPQDFILERVELEGVRVPLT